MRRYLKSISFAIERAANYHIPWNAYEKTLWILSSVSWVLILLSLCFFFMVLFSYLHTSNQILEIFAVCGLGCLFLGVLGTFAFPCPRISFVSTGDKALITLFFWGIVSVIVSIPIYVHAPKQGFSAALFEGISCLTTTGVSLVSSKAPMPFMIEFWCVFIQWMGGIGIVLLSFALVPALKLNSNFILLNEFSQSFEKTTPRTRTMALHIIFLYLGLTLVLTAGLWIGRRLSFQTCLHYSMSCISTGGIQASYYPLTVLNFYEKFILTIGMILGAIPFIKIFQRIYSVKKALQDDQIRGYFLLFCVSFLVMCTNRCLTFDHMFSAVSCTTSTGFVCAPSLNNLSSLWCLGLVLLGGCSGSSAGGFKIFRFQLMYRISKNKLLKIFHPKRFIALKYNGKVVQQEDIILLMTSIFIYSMGCFGVSLLFSFLGRSPKIACLLTFGLITNSGGGVYCISPYVQDFSVIEQWVGIFTMLLGRLEAVIVLFITSFISFR
ncbi:MULTISPECIES: potassium transporter TrkG [Holospora]|uniref:Putative cation transporter n=2 Tax=Holospora TaxID=44747 RepID=A0A061JG30_9PROT|nr:MULTISPECIES: potassium transporter TrkG [Holospora]ETZ04841.1 putative cation transporter [Holospora undulata HU1]GAJ46466.1 putative cation transporter [Holospora elegans E1]